MYERHDRPDRPGIEDLVEFWRVARDEVRTVTLEAAGVAAGHLATAAEVLSTYAMLASQRWRGRADELAPSLPVPVYWQETEADVPQDDDELQRQAERAAAKSRHPSTFERERP